jgi:hypothetical protein
VSIWGALRSFVSARFNLFPDWICFKSSLEAMIKWVVDEFNKQVCRSGAVTGFEPLGGSEQ